MAFFFPPRDQRLRYLGFDDRWVMLVGIPLMTLVAALIFAGTGPHNFVLCATLGGVYTFVYWVVNRAAVLALRRRFPRQEDIAKRLLLMVVVALASVLAFEITTRFIYRRWVPWVTEAGFGDAPLLFQMIISFVLCVLVVAIYESVYFFTQYRRSMLERERLARANAQAQLASLREQVNPHFLFNSLNTLVNVIPEDPDRAVRFTQRLSAVYRRILEYRYHETIPLEEELTAVRDYVFLLQTRFEDNLIVNWHDDHGARPRVPGELHLPPLSVQLLVENAIKHNVVSAAHPLVINVEVAENAVTVTNSLRPRSSVTSTGWGQQSIRSRYRALTDREVVIEKTASHYRVRLPLIGRPTYQPATDALPV